MAYSSVALPQERKKEDKKESAAGSKTDGKQEKDERKSLADNLRSLFAELLGTFALTLAAAGGEVIASVSHGEVSHAARAVAPALVVLALIYALGDCSGAHFNPAVTFAFSLRRDFPWRRLPGYWGAQIAGATLAALLLRTLFGNVAHLGATHPMAGIGASAAFVMEIVLTCLLVVVILGTATRYTLVGPNAALAVGATIALCGLFAGPISGASMNPARSLGPALASGSPIRAGIYVAGPLIGSALASLLMAILHTKKDPKEEEAAEGDN